MRKNQKYSQEEMFVNVEEWHQSGLSQPQYCKHKGFPLTTFSHWVQKYRKQGKGIPVNDVAKSFIPLKVTTPGTVVGQPGTSGEITISYPNGVKVTCPLTIDMEQLRKLVQL